MKGSSKIKKSDWSQGENSFADITAGVAQLAKTGYLGRYALVVSPDLFLDLQRLQPNTGLLEIDRIKKLIGDNVYMTQRHGVPAKGRARVRPSPSTWILPSAWICRLATWSSRTSTTRSVSWKQPPSA